MPDAMPMTVMGTNDPADSDDRIEAIAALITGRQSVRGFTPDSVDPAILEKIFTLAQSAPSNCNVQPWVVHVLSGGSAERMRRVLEDTARDKAEVTPDIPLTGGYRGLHRERQIDAAKRLFHAQGIAREDLVAREGALLRNYRFFDAPHVAFLFMPSIFGVREASDVGMYAQTLMLVMSAFGIGSCAQGALSTYAGHVRAELGIGDDLRLLFGIAFGFVDEGHPANTARTTRVPLGESVTFHP